MDERGQSVALTERERAARHFGVDVTEVTAEMIQQLPPRGTGLETGKARGADMELLWETEEHFKEAETDYCKKHGVKRIGSRTVYDAGRTKDGIHICSDSITTWYFDDKEPEPLKSIRMCVTIPDEFLEQIKKEFDPPGEIPATGVKS